MGIFTKIAAITLCALTITGCATVKNNANMAVYTDGQTFILYGKYKLHDSSDVNLTIYGHSSGYVDSIKFDGKRVDCVYK